MGGVAFLSSLSYKRFRPRDNNKDITKKWCWTVSSRVTVGCSQVFVSGTTIYFRNPPRIKQGPQRELECCLPKACCSPYPKRWYPQCSRILINENYTTSWSFLYVYNWEHERGSHINGEKLHHSRSSRMWLENEKQRQKQKPKIPKNPFQRLLRVERKAIICST